ncbi:pre-mRNA cleavage complex II protein Clp1, putative [Phytophthora infestans T30-4]|uniref:Pre-mRNA cleavage complex II protein Clp1, putative n=1 Tax=Phytophthora infestans (strain T30-4) TaxID=403677 RepID=D0NWZ0_PHYIT|nr:pre-mRNA cleavage complex II protein Clp1, putative [Phytophthora infestans T30-4]EEY67582.1 pre-mRNA cleavage complex II protein Clp1, putative [Phytophthora infestans T30-4]|eukprot:XP_002896347.1 pre-mRNA cleavage complex II protein Clp1, putative [Phytophthora infestans T30-4]
MSTEAATTTEVVARECEYRVEVPPQTEVGIKLKSGSAELFGVELAIDREYVFRDRKLAIFTWYGCTLEVRGALEEAYTSEETPMDSYLNIHAQLQRRRELAKAKHAAGPRVLVCGPVDSGKSTLTQILVNYALRLGEKPTLVELDVGQGCLSVPGTISASPLDMNSLSIEEDFILTNPLAYFYGHAASSENVELFRYQQQVLSKAVKRRLANDEEVNASGCVINTCGWVDGTGFDMLVHAIKDFDVDLVLVIGQDRLYSRLQSALTGANANGADRSIVKLSRSGGVVPLNSKMRSAARISSIREYFYGAHALTVAIPTLSPCINELSFDDVSFFAIKDMKVSDVMLPYPWRKPLNLDTHWRLLHIHDTAKSPPRRQQISRGFSVPLQRASCSCKCV